MPEVKKYIEETDRSLDACKQFIWHGSYRYYALKEDNYQLIKKNIDLENQIKDLKLKNQNLKKQVNELQLKQFPLPSSQAILLILAYPLIKYCFHLIFQTSYQESNNPGIKDLTGFSSDPFKII